MLLEFGDFSVRNLFLLPKTHISRQARPADLYVFLYLVALSSQIPSIFHPQHPSTSRLRINSRSSPITLLILVFYNHCNACPPCNQPGQPGIYQHVPCCQHDFAVELDCKHFHDLFLEPLLITDEHISRQCGAP